MATCNSPDKYWTPEEHRLLLRLVAAGVSICVIALQLERSPTGVSKRLYGLRRGLIQVDSGGRKKRRASPGWPREYHGMSQHPLYSTFKDMVRRCTNPACADWPLYGGRGIQLADDFNPYVVGITKALKNYIKACEAIGWTPQLHGIYTIDREDGDKHYSADNLKLATRREQLLSRRPFTYRNYEKPT